MRFLLIVAVLLQGEAQQHSFLRSRRRSGARQRSCRDAGCRSTWPLVAREESSNFAGRPAKGGWGEGLKLLAARGGKDPCKADMLAITPDRPVGWGSRVNNFMNEIITAMYFNYSFALCDWGADSFYQRIWRRHFDNAVGFPICSSSTKQCGRHDKDGLRVGLSFMGKLAAKHPEYVVDMKRFIYSSVYTYDPETLHRIEENLTAAGVGEGVKYHAVHIRRGDKVTSHEAHAVPTDIYAAAVNKSRSVAELADVVRKEVHSDGAQHVFLATDDPVVKQELELALGPNTTIHQLPPPIAKRGEGYSTRGYQRDEDVMQVLTDIEALRRGAKFIGTASSNIGRLVFFLRPSSSPSLSLDDGGDWLHRPGRLDPSFVPWASADDADD